jgi:superfamily II DNA or RNA helicase
MSAPQPQIYFDSLGWIERRWFDQRPSVLERVRSNMLIKPKFDTAEDPAIDCMFEADGWIGLPWQYAIDLRDEFPDTLRIERDVSRGMSTMRAPKRPTPRDPEQRKFFLAMIRETTGHECVMAEAMTGTGKTVAALNMIAEHGLNALVIVPQRALAIQWAEEAKLHLGLTDDDIGFVMGGRKHVIDRPLTIAVINNLLLDGVIHDNTFGTVVWDESHKLGAREFSRTMALFNARHRVAMTATTTRPDGCDVMVSNYFGKTRVRSSIKAMACTCYEIGYTSKDRPPPWMIQSKQDGGLIKWLSEDQERNAILSTAANKLWKSDRKILVLSHFIEHAEALRRQFIIDNKVDEDEVGLYTGSYTVADTGNRRRTSKRELERIKSDCPVIFGTYSMLSTGIDIPRMDAGIEATPRAHNVQAIGRIRRQFAGKSKGRWFSITDLALHRFVAYSKSRLREFREAGVVVRTLTANQVYNEN